MDKQKPKDSPLTELSKTSYKLGIMTAANYVRREALKSDVKEIYTFLFALADEINELADKEE